MDESSPRVNLLVINVPGAGTGHRDVSTDHTAPVYSSGARNERRLPRPAIDDRGSHIGCGCLNISSHAVDEKDSTIQIQSTPATDDHQIVKIDGVGGVRGELQDTFIDRGCSRIGIQSTEAERARSRFGQSAAHTCDHTRKRGVPDGMNDQFPTGCRREKTSLNAQVARLGQHATTFDIQGEWKGDIHATIVLKRQRVDRGIRRHILSGGVEIHVGLIGESVLHILAGAECTEQIGSGGGDARQRICRGKRST